MASKKRGGRKEEEREKFQLRGEQKEKEEKEKEKEGEKGEERPRGRRRASREKPKEKRTKRSLEEAPSRSLRRDWHGSRFQEKGPVGKMDKADLAEGKGSNFIVGEFRLEQFNREGQRGHLRRQVENSEDFYDLPWSPGFKDGGEHHASLGSTVSGDVGDRRWQFASSDEPVPQDFFGPPHQWGHATRTAESYLGDRPIAACSTGKGPGHPDTTCQVPGANGDGCVMARSPEAGSYTSQRTHLGVAPRSSDSKQRPQARQGVEDELYPAAGETTERQRKRQRQRKGQEQGEERQGRQEKGVKKGSSEEDERSSLLRVGEKKQEGVIAMNLPRRGDEVHETGEVTPALPRRGECQRSPVKEVRKCRQEKRKSGSKGTLKLLRRKKAGQKKGVRKSGFVKERVQKRKKEKGADERKGFKKASRVGDASLPGFAFVCAEPAATGDAPFLLCGPTGSPVDSVDSSGLGRVRKKVEECFSEMGCLGEMFEWLAPRVDEHLMLLRKAVPTGRVFPLPSSPLVLSQLFPESPQKVLLMLRCLVLSLNSLNGEGLGDERQASEFHVNIVRGLLEDCERVSRWKVAEASPTWEEFFRVKGVDYRGEEILTAQTMRWENVAPALPDEIGGVNLEQVLELGCLHYVKHFEDYLLDPEDQPYVRPPRVMVPPDNWPTFCEGLLKKGVFAKVHEDDIYRVHNKPLLSGLFGVSKNEFSGPWEVQRVIMNLIPLNSVCRSFEGDVGTLPAWSGMSPLHLEPDENLVISSEDVRAFFYIFRVPEAWHRFLAFNRPLPEHLAGDRPGAWYPCSAVLPMGFKNSVSLAQHVHRFIVKKAVNKVGLQGGEAELRKDRSFTSSNPMFRIYLDNFDQLERTSREMAETLKGSVSSLVLGIREEYSALGVPRHPKKAVQRSLCAEVQGAIVDGVIGIAHPKVEKIAKYAHLTRLVLEAGESTQRQMQVVGGGLVYMCMFRRPLLSSLNHVWKFIVNGDGYPPFIKFKLPPEVHMELTRFLGLIPVAYMDFRTHISPMVTASDASEYGGGVTASSSLTPAGTVAANCPIRGDIMEPMDMATVLTIGLFDGIGALRVACDALGWNVQGHISVEVSKEASRVVESKFPNTLFFDDVQKVDLEVVKGWAQKFTQVSLIILGSGPPCQGVSGLNASRKGALRDSRSNLFVHVDRIRTLVQQCFPWAQVKSLMESVASMDQADEQVMSDSFGGDAWYIDASGVSLAHRPRLYWIDWEISSDNDAIMGHTPSGRASLELKATLDPTNYLTPGWKLKDGKKLPTFTTSRPRAKPGYKPAGIHQCAAHEVARWKLDEHRFPPYQYMDVNCLTDKRGNLRVPGILEREVIMGFPKGYTQNCLPKAQQKTSFHQDVRLSLIGNSWNVTVVAWLLSQLGSLLGLHEPMSVEEVVKRTSPGCTKDFQTFLQRPFMRAFRRPQAKAADLSLVKRFLTLVSFKGEDLMLQSSSEDLVKYHRLRSSIPSNLWRWQSVASWRWTGNKEHINSLELRAVLTALRWRLERHKSTRQKFVHLLDSMVVLHCLSRGRSSSRKLRRTMLKITALLLATKSQGVWAYVHTSQNPADEPSRRPNKHKWKHAKKASWSSHSRRQSSC